MGQRRGDGITFTNSNGLKFRTSNSREAQAADALRIDGYEVIKRGWPDLIAIKDGKVRLVEVKDHNGKLKAHQLRMAEALSRYGLEVEVWPEGDVHKARNWRKDAKKA